MKPNTHRSSTPSLIPNPICKLKPAVRAPERRVGDDRGYGEARYRVIAANYDPCGICKAVRFEKECDRFLGFGGRATLAVPAKQRVLEKECDRVFRFSRMRSRYDC
jgi:hypothetical protein